MSSLDWVDWLGRLDRTLGDAELVFGPKYHGPTSYHPAFIDQVKRRFVSLVDDLKRLDRDVIDGGRRSKDPLVALQAAIETAILQTENLLTAVRNRDRLHDHRLIATARAALRDIELEVWSLIDPVRRSA